MIRKIAVNTLLLLCSLHIAAGQEVVTGLQSEPLIRKNIYKYLESKSLSADTLELPFFDDFSGSGVFPDPVRWTDNFVFINNTFTDSQITTGVATFDAINNKGRMYDNASTLPFVADYLTSKPVNASYPASDNLWLTFYYQAGGLADPPEGTDSLVVQFFAPAENKWYTVWDKPGSRQASFRLAQIRIENPRYLKKGFRFRFFNYASLSPVNTDPSIASNCDQWNIDYVQLGRNRNKADTILRDVAFRYPNRSLLKTHEAMPWKQFAQVSLQEMGSFIPIHYRNNDSITRNVTRNFEILDVYNNNPVKSFSAGATNINARTSVDFNANLIYTFSSPDKDSALFRVKSWLITDNFDPKGNDTTLYYQKFSNYFAFDDGSSEAGYGINGLGSRNAMVAYRFRSFMPDTLRAVNICFNDSYMDANQRSFDLMVWDDVDGHPGNLLYTKQNCIVKQGEDLNGFYTYQLNQAVPVAGTFYVGWKQLSETFLNAGLDINTAHGGKQLYAISGIWNTSSVAGTLMIRPVVGAPLTTSIGEIFYHSRPKLIFRPNPASDYIILDGEDILNSRQNEISVVDMQGRELLRVPWSNIIDISQLRKGAYIIVSTRNGIPEAYNRLIKTR